MLIQKMMKFCMFVFLVVVGAVIASGTDHNQEAHKALCDLLNAAVRRWGSNGESLTEPLKSALNHTVFGSNGVGDLEGLRKALPKVYDEVLNQSGSRSFSCGQRLAGQASSGGVKHERWSGHSASHDLLCLCTLGDNGWPLNNTGSEKLCGKSLNELGTQKDQGWHGKGSGKPQMEAAWTNVIKECLQGDKKGTNLKNAFDDFKKTLKHTTGDEEQHGNRHILGKGDFSDYPCSGNGQICVMYYNEAKPTGEQHPKPWWVELEYAIKKDEAEKEQKKREEEKRKQDEINQQKLKQQKQSQHQDVPRAAALKAANTEMQEKEPDDTQNISNPIATIEEASGTLIIPPCPWFLSAILLI
ncbi:Variant surface glycoprotein [Trypanosoma congolense IL3000]|uniref:Variant surface glycoprotein n=1 Tax=Trypanosoma congolense (strain IL3000) TaxID=1068625 RepID=F9WHB8_TRYCI|nr:Variant surface glycoprotein [Trypanosoma congolense IL3000]